MKETRLERERKKVLMDDQTFNAAFKAVFAELVARIKIKAIRTIRRGLKHLITRELFLICGLMFFGVAAYAFFNYNDGICVIMSILGFVSICKYSTLVSKDAEKEKMRKYLKRSKRN